MATHVILNEIYAAWNYLRCDNWRRRIRIVFNWEIMIRDIRGNSYRVDKTGIEKIGSTMV